MISTEPNDLYEKLEYDKILDWLSRECLGDLARERVQALRPQIDIDWIQTQLRQTEEMKKALMQSDFMPLTNYEDFSEDLKLLEIIDYVLPLESIQRIHRVLIMMGDIINYFTPERQEIYPELYQLLRGVPYDPALKKVITDVIDEEGNVRPDASPALLRISKLKGSKQRELDKQFRSLINTYRNKGWLTDSVESFRNGRRVLSVPSEHKRKIRGIIHDESATGRTAFIEPEAVIDINNDIFDLENEEKREIYRIIKELCGTLRPYREELAQYQGIIVTYDVIRVKGRLAVALKAEYPEVKDRPHLGIKQGRHPLLYLKNKQIDKPTVPFDLELHGRNRLLMVSGPNAGGKSILMKSVGLIQLMLQSGMLIPVNEASEMGVFHSCFADIGDQQSIEDDLSTYSSRLRNMRLFLEKSDKRSLLLIDEFGSGTDPKIGGAIAEAILRDLNFRKSHGVITTHYSNLKVFAFKTPGIVNGAMHFDKEHLSPTYELNIGRPGSSFAFEIAQKSGLSEKVLKYARHRTGKQEKAVDQLLVDLQREKKEVEEKLAGLEEREKKLEKLIKNYENMFREMEFRRKKMKLDAKAQDLQQVARENKEMEKLVREIKESKNLEKAKKLAAEVRQKRKQLTSETTNLSEEVYKKAPVPAVGKKKKIEVGDFVKLRSGGGAGKVESIDKGKVIVQMGLMKMTTRLQDLVPANEPLPINSKKSINTNVKVEAQFESKVDVRGLTKEEALIVLENFIDKAMISNANVLRIVHGKGKWCTAKCR